MSKAEAESKVRIDLRKNRIYPITPLPDKPEGRSRMPEEEPLTLREPAAPLSESRRASTTRSSPKSSKVPPKKEPLKKHRVSEGAVRKIDSWFTPSSAPSKRKAKSEVDGGGDRLSPSLDSTKELVVQRSSKRIKNNRKRFPDKENRGQSDTESDITFVLSEGPSQASNITKDPEEQSQGSNTTKEPDESSCSPPEVVDLMSSEDEEEPCCSYQSSESDKSQNDTARSPKTAFKTRIFDFAPVPSLHYFAPVPSLPSIPDSSEDLPDLIETEDIGDLPLTFHKLFLGNDSSRNDSDDAIKLTYTNDADIWKVLHKMSTEKRIHATHAQLQKDRNLPWNVLINPKAPENMAWNQHALQSVRNWLSDWKDVQRRQNSQEAKKETKTNDKKKRGKKKLASSSESDSEVEEDLDGDYSLSRMEMVETYDNPLCIVGSHGVGKTTLISVATVAEEYSVIEQGTDAERNQQSMMKLKEATSSHRMFTDIRALFGGAKKGGPSSIAVSTRKSTNTKKQKEFSVLVFEDVDLEGDSFWNPLKQLIADSKIPIVLTCSEKAVVSGRFEKPLFIEVPQPDVNVQTEYLEASLFGLIRAKIPRDFIRKCLEAFGGDFRRCLNQLQLALSDFPSSLSLGEVVGDRSEECEEPLGSSQLSFSHPWMKKEAASGTASSQDEPNDTNRIRTRPRRNLDW